MSKRKSTVEEMALDLEKLLKGGKKVRGIASLSNSLRMKVYRAYGRNGFKKFIEDVKKVNPDVYNLYLNLREEEFKQKVAKLINQFYETATEEISKRGVFSIRNNRDLKNLHLVLTKRYGLTGIKEYLAVIARIMGEYGEKVFPGFRRMSLPQKYALYKESLRRSE